MKAITVPAYLLSAAFLSASAFAIEVPTKVSLSAEQVAAVKASAVDRLSDPDSAKFRKIVAAKFKNGSIYACGEVNAKNKFGGYVGFTGFVAEIMAGGVAEFAGMYGDPIVDGVLEKTCLPVRVANGL